MQSGLENSLGSYHKESRQEKKPSTTSNFWNTNSDPFDSLLQPGKELQEADRVHNTAGSPWRTPQVSSEMTYASDVLRFQHPTRNAASFDDRRVESVGAKHHQKEKSFHCDVPNCARSKTGFGTRNDLLRHKKCVHKIETLDYNDKSFRCAGQNCPKPGKYWPRLDDFVRT